MYDPTVSYRSSQVAASGPVARIVLLYQGAIRFGMQHLAAADRGDREAAHNASMRCQAIVSSLQEGLDLGAGDVAVRLDSLYDFVLGRLVEGNIRLDAAATREALDVLRGLLDAWQSIASAEAPARTPAIAETAPVALAPASVRSPLAAAYGTHAAAAR